MDSTDLEEASEVLADTKEESEVLAEDQAFVLAGAKEESEVLADAESLAAFSHVNVASTYDISVEDSSFDACIASSLSESFDVKMKAMEKRLCESFSSEQKGSEVALDGIKELKETLYAQTVAQQKMSKKIAALEKSCVELGRKHRKHQTAFLDLRGISAVLKDTLSGILCLMDALGVAVEPQMQKHSRLTTRVTRVEKCLLDTDILKDKDMCNLPEESSLSESVFASILPAGTDFRSACMELTEQVNKMTRDFLWLDTREGIDGVESGATQEPLDATWPSSPLQPCWPVGEPAAPYRSLSAGMLPYSPPYGYQHAPTSPQTDEFGSARTSLKSSVSGSPMSKHVRSTNMSKSLAVRDTSFEAQEEDSVLQPSSAGSSLRCSAASRNGGSLSMSQTLAIKDTALVYQQRKQKQGEGSACQASSAGSSLRLDSSLNTTGVRKHTGQISPRSIPTWARADAGTQAFPVNGSLSKSMPTVVSGSLGSSGNHVSTSPGSLRVLSGSGIGSRSASPVGLPAKQRILVSHSARSRSGSPVIPAQQPMTITQNASMYSPRSSSPLMAHTAAGRALQKSQAIGLAKPRPTSPRIHH